MQTQQLCCVGSADTDTPERTPKSFQMVWASTRGVCSMNDAHQSYPSNISSLEHQLQQSRAAEGGLWEPVPVGGTAKPPVWSWRSCAGCTRLLQGFSSSGHWHQELVSEGGQKMLTGRERAAKPHVRAAHLHAYRSTCSPYQSGEEPFCRRWIWSC